MGLLRGGIVTFLLTLCLSAISLNPNLASAYPVLLNAPQITQIFGTPRANLIAIKSDGTTTQRIALQVDEVEDDAALVLRQPYEIRKIRADLAHPQKNDPFLGRIQSVHRIVLDDRDFAACNEDCQKKLPAQFKSVCQSSTAIGLLRVTLDNTQQSVFIVDCGTQVSEFNSRDLKFDDKSKTISAPKYDYVLSSDKNIFFNSIRNKSESRSALTKSEIKAFLKPKYLFNMKFADDDLLSQITSLSRGSQSLSLEVAIALNILAMKINTQICCDVSFYEDALYFPVVLDLPFSGKSFAKGSGLFFGFQTDKESNVKTELIPSGARGVSDAILIQQGKNLIALGFRSPNKNQLALVKPKVVSRAEMEAIKFMPVESSSGIFYDIQTAREGFQHFMVWMLFGQESDRSKLIEYAQYGARTRVEKFTNPDAR